MSGRAGFASGIILLLSASVSVMAATDEATPTNEPTVESQPTTAAAAELQAGLDVIVAETGVPAMAVVAFDADGVRELAVSGIRATGAEDPVGLDDRFHLGSNTKAMTATLVARLAEQTSAVSFETTLAEVFVDPPLSDPDFASVSVADLLAHASGIDDAAINLGSEEDAVTMLAAWQDLAVPEQRANLTDLVLATGPSDPPHLTARYSNGGYVVVGAIVEGATGSSWEDLMREHVFEPLEMDTCGFGHPGDPADISIDQPRGHDEAMTPGPPGPTGDLPAIIGPAGTVHCSVEDWSKFLSEMLNAYAGRSDYLSQRSAHRIFTTVADDSALGWVVADTPNGPVAFHDGSNGWWYSFAVLRLDAGVGVAAVTNAPEAVGQVAVGAAIAALAERHPS